MMRPGPGGLTFTHPFCLPPSSSGGILGVGQATQEHETWNCLFSFWCGIQPFSEEFFKIDGRKRVQRKKLNHTVTPNPKFRGPKALRSFLLWFNFWGRFFLSKFGVAGLELALNETRAGFSQRAPGGFPVKDCFFSCAKKRCFTSWLSIWAQCNAISLFQVYW